MPANSDAMKAEVRSSGEEVPDFFTTPVASDTENEGVCTAPPGEKVGDLFTKQEVLATTNQVVSPTVAPDAPWEGLVESPLQMTVPAPAPLRSGRPATLTPAMMDQICLLLSVGLSRRQAAAYLDIDRSTISHAAARDAEFASNLRRAEDLCTVQPQMVLMGESRKNWRAAAWLMEHKRKYPPALSEEEKEEVRAQQLADKRREVELWEASKLLEEEARERLEQGRKARELARLQRETDERFAPAGRRKKGAAT